MADDRLKDAQASIRGALPAYPKTEPAVTTKRPKQKPAKSTWQKIADKISDFAMSRKRKPLEEKN